MTVELMPHQTAGAEFLALQSTALLYWDQGSGKTYAVGTAIDIVQELNEEEGFVLKPTLVLCPAVARRNHAREFKLCQTRRRNIVVVEDSKADFANADLIICSYDLAARPEVHAKLMEQRYDVLVLDELQYCKNPDAKRTRAVFGVRTQPGIVAQADQVFALSGTPAPNHIGELYPWIREAHPEAIRLPSGRSMGGSR